MAIRAALTSKMVQLTKEPALDLMSLHLALKWNARNEYMSFFDCRFLTAIISNFLQLNLKLIEKLLKLIKKTFFPITLH